MTLKPRHLAGVSAMTVAGIGLLGWILDPGHSFRWSVVVLEMPAAWGLTEMLMRSRADTRQRESRAILDSLRLMLAWVGMVITIGVGFKMAIAAGLVADAWLPFMLRLRGAFFGIGLALWGNYLPKLLSPWTREAEPFDWQGVHRFVGWVALLAGILLVLAWLAIPVPQARIASLGIVGTFVVLSLTRKMMSIGVYSRRPRTDGGSS